MNIIPVILIYAVLYYTVWKLAFGIKNKLYLRKEEADKIVTKKNSIKTIIINEPITQIIVNWIGNNVLGLINHTDVKYYKSSRAW